VIFYKSGGAFTAKQPMEVAPKTQNEDEAEHQSTIPRHQDTEPLQKCQHKGKVILLLPPGMAPGTKYCLWCDRWGHECHSFNDCDENQKKPERQLKKLQL